MWRTSQGCTKKARLLHGLFTQMWGPLRPPSGTAAALVGSLFADAALGALRTAHGAAGAAAFLAGSTFALFAFAGASAGAGSIGGTGAVGVHGEWRRRLKIDESPNLI